MDTQIIGIKQLQSQLKRIADEALLGKSFTVVRNSQPVFKIEPVAKTEQKKYSLKDLSRLQEEIGFNGGKNLSKDIDRIVYGL